MDVDRYSRKTFGRRYYSEGVVALVLERISAAVAAGVPIVDVFDDPALPCRASFYNWLSSDEELRTRFEQARTESADKQSAHQSGVLAGV